MSGFQFLPLDNQNQLITNALSAPSTVPRRVATDEEIWEYCRLYNPKLTARRQVFILMLSQRLCSSCYFASTQICSPHSKAKIALKKAEFSSRSELAGPGKECRGLKMERSRQRPRKKQSLRILSLMETIC